MTSSILRHEFVEFIPADLLEDVIYVSVMYATAVHRCCCGCGSRVVTPISPGGWTLTFNGETISLAPSIGNWSFPCRSHYWIRRNRVEWDATWSDAQTRPLAEVERRTMEDHIAGRPRGRDKSHRRTFWNSFRKLFNK